jgi:hypothetical protein
LISSSAGWCACERRHVVGVQRERMKGASCLSKPNRAWLDTFPA